MRKLMLLPVGVLLALAATTTPAFADPVNVTHDNACYNANINGGKDLLFSGMCYLGPPPINVA